MNNLEYAGFWIRVVASLIDSLLIMIIIIPLLSLVYGEQYWLGDSFVTGFWDLMFNYILPAVVVILFWIYKSATPGKMVLRLKIVDADTGHAVPAGRLIGRYLSYYLSIIPLFLGVISIGFDRRKQGWHDKIAGTVVVRDTRKEAVRFSGQA